MASKTDELKARFQATGNDERVSPKPGRRRDYKGARKKLTLRVSEELLDRLGLLRLAGNVETNTFCVAAIEAAVAERLADLEKSFDKDSWDVMVRCANAKSRKGG